MQASKELNEKQQELYDVIMRDINYYNISSTEKVILISKIDALVDSFIEGD